MAPLFFPFFPRFPCGRCSDIASIYKGRFAAVILDGEYGFLLFYYFFSSLGCGSVNYIYFLGFIWFLCKFPSLLLPAAAGG